MFCQILSRSSAIDQVEWKIPTAVWEECGYVDKYLLIKIRFVIFRNSFAPLSKSNKRATMKLTDSVVSDAFSA